MNTIRKIVKNSGASLLTQISTPACSFLLVFFIAKFLGVSGLGTYSAALSLLFMFQAFSSLGFQHLITREVAQDKSKADDLFFNASFLIFIFSIFMAGIMCLVINLITDNNDIIHAAYILSISLIPYSLALVSQSICRGYEKLEHITVAIVIGNVFKVLVGSFILLKGYGLLILMIVILASHFLTFFLSLYYAIRNIQKPLHKICRIDFAFCKWVIRSTHIFALIFVFSAIRRNVDVLIITSIMGPIDVGLYSAASKLMNIFRLGASSYIFALQPMIFRFYLSSFEKYKLLCVDSIRYLFIITIPIAVVVTFLSDKFILLIFEKEFIPSANVLSILIWLLIISSFNQIFANALIASNNQKVNLQANIIGMVVNIFLNILLIPLFGFIGAGIANISSAFITLVYQYYFVSRRLFKVNFIYLAIKPFASAVIMGVIILLYINTSLFLLIPISGIVYLIGLLVLNAFSERDLALFRRLLKERGA